MISVVVPVHQPRIANGMLADALESVWAQTLPPAAVHVTVDQGGEGAAATRNRGLAAVATPWVAFLDSDDVLLPNHLERCMAHADRSGADVVYPWFIGDDSIAGNRFGLSFDAALIRRGNYIPVTVLARTDAVRAAGGFIERGCGDHTLEDWGCWLAMLDNGATFSHLAERTWVLRRHDGNTGGKA